MAWCCLRAIAQSETNYWTSPTSGNWEDLSWSLGRLPGPGQSIFIADHGWKAVAIGYYTARDYPETLTVDAINVITPGTDTVNMLMFNYPGLQTPIKTGTLYVSNDAALLMLYSALEVAGARRIKLVAGEVTRWTSQRSTSAATQVGARFDNLLCSRGDKRRSTMPRTDPRSLRCGIR